MREYLFLLLSLLPATVAQTVDPCSAIRCPGAFDCYVTSTGEPECRAYFDFSGSVQDTCQAVVCAPLTRCRTQVVYDLVTRQYSDVYLPECIEYDPCEELTCADGSTCEVNSTAGTAACVSPCDQVTCPVESSCQVDSTGNAACVHVCDQHTCPDGSSCQVDSTGNAACVNPCDGVQCANGELCVVDNGNPVCPDPVDPCQQLTCPAGSSCQVDSTGTADCVNPCDGVQCASGELCVVDNGNPVCPDPVDPCQQLTCPAGSSCQVDSTGNADCVSPCDGVQCGNGELCVVENGNPVCPDPVDPCQQLACPAGSSCQIDSTGNADCVNPCDGVQCANGEPCVVENGNPVCPDPVDPCQGVQCASGELCVVDNGNPVCRDPVDPCQQLACPDGSTCEADATGSVVCVSPCDRVTCSSGVQCTVVNGQAVCDVCQGTVCSNGVQCVVVNGQPACPSLNPCQTVSCTSGVTCVVVNGQAICPVPGTDPCQGVNCPSGERCVQEAGQLRCAPIPPDPCVGFVCAIDEQCVADNGFPGCLSLCQGFACPTGEKCAVDNGQATCVVTNTDPCQGFGCPTGEECAVDNGQATCVVTNTDPCQNTACPANFRCETRATGPRCSRYLDNADPLNTCTSQTCAGDQSCLAFRIVDPATGNEETATDCRPDPCNTVDCGADAHCESTWGLSAAGDPEGATVCVQDPPPSDCATVSCPQEFTCGADETAGIACFRPITLGPNVATNPCTNFQGCGEAEVCTTIIRYELVQASYEVVAKCAPHPCTLTQCSDGEGCILEDGLPICVNPCTSHLCDPDKECVSRLTDATSASAGLLQYAPECVPLCERYQAMCPNDFTCITKEGVPLCSRQMNPEGPDVPCINTPCGPGKLCSLFVQFDPIDRVEDIIGECVDDPCVGETCGLAMSCMVDTEWQPDGTLELFARCVDDPTAHPCYNYQCPEGEECLLDTTNAAQCVNPCTSHQCQDPVNTQCVSLPTMDPSGVPQMGRYHADCVDKCRMLVGQCPPAYYCEVWEGRALCIQPITMDTRDPKHPCVTQATTCDAGKMCVAVKFLEPVTQYDGVFTPCIEDPCHSMTCDFGMYCEVRHSVLTSGEVEMWPECVMDPDVHPCARMVCSGDQICTLHNDQAACVHPNPCEGHVCPEKTVCELMESARQTGSPDVWAECVPDPALGDCATLNCGFYERCHVTSGRAYCAPYDPCQSHVCPDGHVCEVIEGTTAAGQTSVWAQCAALPVSGQGACANVRCKAGFTCHPYLNNPLCTRHYEEMDPRHPANPCLSSVHCLSGRCIPLLVMNMMSGRNTLERDCVGGDATASDRFCNAAPCAEGAECVPVETCGGATGCIQSEQCVDVHPCLRADCGDGYQCQELAVPCLVAPCPKVVSCVQEPDPNMCDGVMCSEGALCMPRYKCDNTGNCVNWRECVQLHPCQSDACDLGFRCEEVDTPCQYPECPRKAHCVRDCPEVMCLVACDHGYGMNANSCQTCDCLPDPNANICQPGACPTGTMCHVMKDCDAAGICREWPECMTSDPCQNTLCGPGEYCLVEREAPLCTTCPPELRARCMPDTTGPTPGHCPDPDPMMMRPCVSPVDQCLSDTQCGAGYKCCPNMCGMECLEAVPDVVCPALTCPAVFCAFGRQKDAAGCDTCDCRNPCQGHLCPTGEVCEVNVIPAMCANCETYYEPRCAPRTPAPRAGLCPQPDYSLPTACPAVPQADCYHDADCPDYRKCCPGTCLYSKVCEVPCPEVACRLTCPHGFKDGLGGCPVCECADPCQALQCRQGFRCNVLPSGQPTCEPYDLCAGMACAPGTECRLDNGAAVCVRINPCNSYSCPPGTECKVVTVPTQGCTTASCPIQYSATCQLITVPEVKPGTCRPDAFLSQATCLRAACTEDGQCPGTEKCCASLCGLRCTTIAVPATTLFCPTPDFPATLYMLLPQQVTHDCAENSDCAGSQLCCDDFQGRRCMDGTSSQLDFRTLLFQLLAEFMAASRNP